jgi:hypothetical protein
MRLLLVRLLGGITHLPMIWSSMCGHARGGGLFQRAGSLLNESWTKIDSVL